MKFYVRIHVSIFWSIKHSEIIKQLHQCTRLILFLQALCSQASQ